MLTIPQVDTPPRSLQAAMIGMRRDRRERAFQALYVIGSTGYATAQEVRTVLETSLDLKPDNSSIRRAVMEELPQLGLAVVQSFPYIRNSRLSLIRLSPQGQQHYQELFGLPGRSEWEQITQEHAGDRFLHHAVGLAACCMQARRHGWQAAILPDNGLEVNPDILIWQDGQRPVYVEFETRARSKLQKWAKARRAHGYAAICTFTKSCRSSLVRECQKVGVPGMATDLESLVRDMYPGNAPLWLESWGGENMMGSAYPGSFV